MTSNHIWICHRGSVSPIVECFAALVGGRFSTELPPGASVENLVDDAWAWTLLDASARVRVQVGNWGLK